MSLWQKLKQLFFQEEKPPVVSPSPAPSAPIPAPQPEEETPKAPSARPVAIPFPHTEELLDGALKVHIHHHHICPQDEPFACWSFITEGLWKCRHRELVLTLRVPEDTSKFAYPREFLEIFALLCPEVERGVFAEIGSFTVFPEEILGYKGLAYIPCDPLQDVPIHAPAMTAVALYPEETEVLATFGSARLLAQMTLAERYYPAPFWIDINREPLLLQFMNDSLLVQIPSVQVPSASFVLREDTLVLRLRPAAHEMFQSILHKIPENQPLALLTAIDQSAETCMVWVPSSEETVVVGASDDVGLMTGCYLCFLPEQESISFKQVEDGMMCLLPTEGWQDVRQALLGKHNVFLEPESEDVASLAIEWLLEDELFRSQELFAAESLDDQEAWSERPPTDRETPVQLLETRLLTAEDDFSQRVTVEELGDYLRSLMDTMEVYAQNLDREGEFDLLVQVTLMPEQELQLELAYRPELPEPSNLLSLHDTIQALPLPVVTEGTIELELLVAVWGGDPNHRVYLN